MRRRVTFLLSSMAEQRAVNSKVPGSSPGGGAIGTNHPIRYDKRRYVLFTVQAE